MIVAYVENGLSKEGFSLLCQMMFHSGLPLNIVTLCSISSACARSGDAVMRRWVHVYSLKTMGKEMDIMVGPALLNMCTQNVGRSIMRSRCSSSCKIGMYWPGMLCSMV